MQFNKLLNFLETKYPLSIQEEWDNSGIQIRSNKTNIQSIYVALDPTINVIDNAIKSKADLIITHHPLYFESIKEIDSLIPIGSKTIELINNNISLYSIHTNYDKVSMSYVVAYELGFDKVSTLDEINRYGCIVDLTKQLSSNTITKNALKKLGVSQAKLYGTNSKVKKLAIMPGSGKSFIDTAISKGCDMILTGDIDYHTGINASERGIVVADIGHYEIEHMFVKHMVSLIRKEFPDIKVKGHKTDFPTKLVSL